MIFFPFLKKIEVEIEYLFRDRELIELRKNWPVRIREL